MRLRLLANYTFTCRYHTQSTTPIENLAHLPKRGHLRIFPVYNKQMV